MGNTLQRRGKVTYFPVQPLKFATEEELKGTWDVPCPVAGRLRRYMGSGETWEEALAALHKVCVENGIPVPEQVNDDRWSCGTIDIQHVFKVKQRLNPVWNRRRNGREFAFVYYPPI